MTPFARQTLPNANASDGGWLVGVEPDYQTGELTKSFLAELAAGGTLDFQVMANATTPNAILAGGFFPNSSGMFFPDVTLTITRVQ